MKPQKYGVDHEVRMKFGHGNIYETKFRKVIVIMTRLTFCGVIDMILESFLFMVWTPVRYTIKTNFNRTSNLPEGIIAAVMYLRQCLTAYFTPYSIRNQRAPKLYLERIYQLRNTPVKKLLT